MTLSPKTTSLRRSRFVVIAAVLSASLGLTGNAGKAAVLTDDLIAHFTFDSDAFGTGAGGIINSVGTGNNATATATAPTNVAGKIGEAARFSSGKIVADSTTLGNTDAGSFSFSLWFKPANLTSTQTLVAKGRSDSTQPGWSLLMKLDPTEGNQLSFGAGDGTAGGGDSAGDSFNASLSLNTWYQVAVVFDYASLSYSLYLNGQSLGSGAVPLALGTLNTTAKLSFGASMNAANTSSYRALASGSVLDDFGMWNRTLSSSEVQQIYNAGLAGQAIPEPGSVALMAAASLGLLGAAFFKRRRQKC